MGAQAPGLGDVNDTEDTGIEVRSMDTVSAFQIQKSTTVREAMRRLDQTARKILFVCEDGVLLAALTDGDIRRHLLHGGGLEDQVILAANRNPRTVRDWAEAAQLLQAEDYLAVPVVGADGSVLDIVFASEESAPPPPRLGLPVVIMAGGKGARLDPYTRVLPKPLIPVGDYPIIEHIMRQFESYGCPAFHVIVNYKKQLMKAYFNESSQHYDVTWYDEDRPLGTGGGLYLLKETLKETFFLTNCDVLLRSDYADMLKFHRDHGNAITMIGVYKTLTIPYGVVDIGTNGVIEAMREKPELSFLTNTGIYIVEPQVLEDIPDYTVLSFPEIIEMQRQKGNKVAVYPVSEEEWMDMGQLTELEDMRQRLYGK